jgi:hypothetical protein
MFRFVPESIVLRIDAPQAFCTISSRAARSAQWEVILYGVGGK